MTTNGDIPGDAEMAECDGGQVVTMMDVLKEQQDFEDDANAVLGGSDEKECTYSQGYIKRQAIYACLSCCPESIEDPTKRAGFCLACSLSCHENHDLVELYTKRNFRCDCGNPKFKSSCQFTPRKPDLNEDNTYNQNFIGLYCICSKPYDQDSALDDEMIQCIICEDWWHTTHLDAFVPANDQYAEMICKLCMSKNEFIHDYSEFAVKTESSDVDIINSNGVDSSITVDNLTNGNSETDLTNGSVTDKIQTCDSEENMETNSVDNKGEFKSNVDTSFLHRENSLPDLDDLKSINEPTYAPMETDETDKATELLSDTGVNIPDITSIDETKENSNNTSEESGTICEEKSDESCTTSERKSVEPITTDVKLDELSTTSEDKLDEPTTTSEERLDAPSITSEEKIDEPTTTSEERLDAPSITSEEKIDEPTTTSEERLDTPSEEKLDEPSTTSEDQYRPSIIPEDESDEPCITSEEKSDKTNNTSSMEDSDQPYTTSNEKIEDQVKSEGTTGSTDTSEDIQNTYDNKPSSLNTHDKAETPQENENPAADSEKVAEITEQSEQVTNESKISEDKLEITVEVKQDDANESPTDETKATASTNEMNESNDATPDAEMNENKVTENVPADNMADETNVEQSAEDINDRTEPEIPITTEPELVTTENKRKMSIEDNDMAAKKPKIDTCIRPKGVKKVHKGATFWPATFRQKLCKCNECIKMYKDLSVLFLTDLEDTVMAYETLGKERTAGKPNQYEKGMEALCSLGRIQQIDALTEYNKMRDKLLTFLQSFKDKKVVVTEHDIKTFFAGMKPEKRDDGVYFCG